MEFCEFCNLSFTDKSTKFINDHLNNCLDNLSHLDAFEPSDSAYTNNKLIINTCITCDKNLSRYSFQKKKDHILRCHGSFSNADRSILTDIYGSIFSEDNTENKPLKIKRPKIGKEKLVDFCLGLMQFHIEKDRIENLLKSRKDVFEIVLKCVKLEKKALENHQKRKVLCNILEDVFKKDNEDDKIDGNIEPPSLDEEVEETIEEGVWEFV